LPANYATGFVVGQAFNKVNNLKRELFGSLFKILVSHNSHIIARSAPRKPIFRNAEHSALRTPHSALRTPRSALQKTLSCCPPGSPLLFPRFSSDGNPVIGLNHIMSFTGSTNSVAERQGARLRALDFFQERAAEFNSVLEPPQFEETPGEMRQAMTAAINEANAALDRVGQLKPGEVNFQNSVLALDDLGWRAGQAASRIHLLKEAHEDPAMRETGAEMIKVYEEWAVGLDYREDVYAAVKAYADTQPNLEGEDLKLFEETMRDYRRAGLHLPKEQRQEVERLRKDLARLSTDFEANITKARLPLKFTRRQLEGVPEAFLNQPGIKTGQDECAIMANVTFQFLVVMENARLESARKRLKIARFTLAQEENRPLLQQIVELRDLIAKKLGYQTWADYQIEPRMAQNAGTAIGFVQKLRAGLESKFASELSEFQKLKAEDTGDPKARIELWDWRYYSNLLKKQRYAVDAEQLRDYFPYPNVLAGLFNICEQVFGLKFEQIDPPWKWTAQLNFYIISDSATGQPMGAFYLDMFPREGKFNHFAQFSLIDGKRLPDGRYQRPVVALICNFPPPHDERPSLLSHKEVETLFHEFGHALHSILTRANSSRFSGASVPRDFVEVPSQVLENWVWDKQVLDSFAAHYQDASKTIPQEVIEKLEEARLAGAGTFYRRQMAMSLVDLVLHTEVRPGGHQDVIELSNRLLGEVFLPVPEGTAFASYFGHLTGYDAGYYGYAWSDAIAADMATVFEKSSGRYFDQQTGRKLREEIYAPGGSRDPNVSIEKFLGRPTSIDPFLKTLGIDQSNP
jgi:thimet oligopeptidase